MRSLCVGDYNCMKKGLRDQPVDAFHYLTMNLPLDRLLPNKHLL